MARFRSIAVRDYGVPIEHVTVFATEAMRRAQNAAAMLEAISSEAEGLGVSVLAPEVETLFGSMGARSSFVDVKGLLLDLGGGSVQMTYMDTGLAKTQPDAVPGYEIAAAQAGRSLPFGAAKLSRILDGEPHEIQAAEKSKLQLGMQRAFRDLQDKYLLEGHASLQGGVSPGHVDADGSGIDIYLCGGGFRGYGSILMHDDPIQPYPIPSIGTYTVPGDRFAETERMLQLNKSYKGKIFGMSKRRRAQFPAILAVVDALIQAVPKIRSVTFCAGGNREGALMMKLPRDIRESNPLDLVGFPLSVAPHVSSIQDETLQAVSASLRSALPQTEAPTVFSLGLGPLFSGLIWSGSGEGRDTNASAALHEVITKHPDHPGLTHLTRAVLGLTLCARWGSSLGPIDQQLRDNLQRLVDSADEHASFWAEYTGAVASVLTSAIPSWPRDPDVVLKGIE